MRTGVGEGHSVSSVSFKEQYNIIEKLFNVDFSNGFNVIDRTGRPIHFKCKKTEQLLYVLVWKNGQSLSSAEICGILREDSKSSQYLFEKNQNYLTQLLTDLRHTLEECGAQDVLKKTSDGYAVFMLFVEVIKE